MSHIKCKSITALCDSALIPVNLAISKHQEFFD